MFIAVTFKDIGLFWRQSGFTFQITENTHQCQLLYLCPQIQRFETREQRCRNIRVRLILMLYNQLMNISGYVCMWADSTEWSQLRSHVAPPLIMVWSTPLTHLDASPLFHWRCFLGALAGFYLPHTLVCPPVWQKLKPEQKRVSASPESSVLGFLHVWGFDFSGVSVETLMSRFYRSDQRAAPVAALGSSAGGRWRDLSSSRVWRVTQRTPREKNMENGHISEFSPVCVTHHIQREQERKPAAAVCSNTLNHPQLLFPAFPFSGIFLKAQKVWKIVQENLEERFLWSSLWALPSSG